MTLNNRNQFRPTVSTLESREVPAVAGVNLTSGVLVISADDTATDVVVNKSGTKVVVTDNDPHGFWLTAPTWRFTASQVKKIEFHGGDGKDRFVNNYSVPTTAWGRAGDDYLVGADANDHLYGGTGADTLKGRGGNDSLYGGSLASGDTLYGGSGKDRFLTQDGDVIKDGVGINKRTGTDAEIKFVNSGSSVWNSDEIEVLDGALQKLYDATNNNRLLKDSGTDDVLTFTKEVIPSDEAGNTVLAYNSSPSTYDQIETYGPVWNRKDRIVTYHVPRKIAINEWNENSSSANSKVIDTLIHELGHNWDSKSEGNSKFEAFLKLSGWKSSKPSGGTHYLSGDGDWYYAKTAATGFFGGSVATGRGGNIAYGKWNPREDFATAWAWYFSNNRSTKSSDSIKEAKLKLIDSFVRSL